MYVVYNRYSRGWDCSLASAGKKKCEAPSTHNAMGNMSAFWSQVEVSSSAQFIVLDFHYIAAEKKLWGWMNTAFLFVSLAQHCNGCGWSFAVLKKSNWYVATRGIA